jgi:lactoylglutathione lyase
MMNASGSHLIRFSRCAPFARSLVGRYASRSLASSASSKRPFEVLGIQQIAIGSETRSGLDELWYKVLGLKQPANRVKLEKENVEEDIVSLGPHPFAVEIDLMTPIDPEKSPKVR